MNGLERERTTLVVVDIQEAFRPYASFAGVASRAAVLVAAARLLGVRRVITEQYPAGLGHTAPEVGIDGEPTLQKVAFSAARADGFDLGGATHAIVCGIETHVCVAQTALDLVARGIAVHLPADAVGSRHDDDHERALARLQGAGVVVSSTEATVFELLGTAAAPEFKAVQRLIV